MTERSKFYRVIRVTAPLLRLAWCVAMIRPAPLLGQDTVQSVLGCALRENTPDHRIRYTDDRKYMVPKRAGGGTVAFSAGIVQTTPYPTGNVVPAAPVSEPSVGATGGGTWRWVLPTVNLECINLYIGTTLLQWFVRSTGAFLGDAVYEGVEDCQEYSPMPEEDEVGGPSATELTPVPMPSCMDPEDDGSGWGGSGKAGGGQYGLYCDLWVEYDEQGRMIVVILTDTCEWREE